jgi:high affinity Mn2+ porin
MCKLFSASPRQLENCEIGVYLRRMAGGVDILDVDGALTYRSENVVEAYYNFAIWKSVHVTLDYEFVDNTVFNRYRGQCQSSG